MKIASLLLGVRTEKDLQRGIAGRRSRHELHFLPFRLTQGKGQRSHMEHGLRPELQLRNMLKETGKEKSQRSLKARVARGHHTGNTVGPYMRLLYAGLHGKPFESRISAHEVRLALALPHDDVGMNADAPRRRRSEKQHAGTVLSVHDRSPGRTFFKQPLQHTHIFPASPREKSRPYIAESLEMPAHEGRGRPFVVGSGIAGGVVSDQRLFRRRAAVSAASEKLARYGHDLSFSSRDGFETVCCRKGYGLLAVKRPVLAGALKTPACRLLSTPAFRRRRMVHAIVSGEKSLTGDDAGRAD